MGGDDELYGDDGKDIIVGDQLVGDSPDGGADFLDGGNGKDPLDGDSGVDECVNGEPAINREAQRARCGNARGRSSFRPLAWQRRPTVGMLIHAC